MCFLGWMYPAVWEMMSHWSSLKQRENCCSPYSFNLPPVFPTYSTLCTLAGQSCPFVFFFITFISLPLSHLPRSLHELSISFFPSCFYLPHWRYSVLLSPSLLFRSFPLFAPPWSVSLPPSHSPALPLFLCLLSLFCLLCVCVCVCDCIFPLTDKRDVLLLLSSRRGSVAELQQRTEHTEADTRCLSERSTTRSRVEFWQPGAFSKFQMCPRILELPAVRLDVLTCKL